MNTETIPAPAAVFAPAAPVEEREGVYVPLFDYILVEPIAGATVTAQGILLPETSKEKPVKGKVLACGPGKREGLNTVPMCVKVGDVVAYGRYCGSEFKVGKVECLIMREAEVMGLIQ